MHDDLIPGIIQLVLMGIILAVLLFLGIWSREALRHWMLPDLSRSNDWIRWHDRRAMLRFVLSLVLVSMLAIGGAVLSNWLAR